MARAKKDQGTSKDTALQLNASIEAKASPDINNISYKSVAGLTEEELLKRNIIATLGKEEAA
jgi:hypothetical protein